MRHSCTGDDLYRCEVKSIAAASETKLVAQNGQREEKRRSRWGSAFVQRSQIQRKWDLGLFEMFLAIEKRDRRASYDGDDVQGYRGISIRANCSC